MSLLPGRVCPAARAVCVRSWWKRRYCGHSGSCRKGVWCDPLWCRTRILGEGDVYYGDGGPNKVYGVDGALGVMVEVPAEDR